MQSTDKGEGRVEVREVYELDCGRKEGCRFGEGCEWEAMMFKRSLPLPSGNTHLTLPQSTITFPSDAASPGDWEASRIGTPGTPSLRRLPHSQTTTTGDTSTLFPLLCTPFTPQASYGPRHLQWEDEEMHQRSELSQEGR